MPVSNVDLMERVCHLTNKIYREMLCITRCDKMKYITTRGLNVQAFSFYSSFELAPSIKASSFYRILLSWDLLDWISEKDGIHGSFTNFITTPELSGPLYISPDVYHTQITEYFLEKINQ